MKPDYSLSRRIVRLRKEHGISYGRIARKAKVQTTTVGRIANKVGIRWEEETVIRLERAADWFEAHRNDQLMLEVNRADRAKLQAAGLIPEKNFTGGDLIKASIASFAFGAVLMWGHFIRQAEPIAIVPAGPIDISDIAPPGWDDECIGWDEDGNCIYTYVDDTGIGGSMAGGGWYGQYDTPEEMGGY